MVESGEYIGRCPVCGEELRKSDIEEVAYGIIIGLPPPGQDRLSMHKMRDDPGFLIPVEH
jgi:hypothetical protein